MKDFLFYLGAVNSGNYLPKLVVCIMIVVLPACGFFGGLRSSTVTQDSAPNVVMKASKIKDAEPRVEPKSRGGNASVYTVFGKSYRVLDSAKGFKERGDASWYGKKFHGRDTANGERYDMFQMTAAHKHLPLPSYVRVTNLENRKSTIVRVNDRGPFHGGRIIDLSYAAATKIDMLKKGTARVEIEVIDPKQWVKAKKSRQRPAKPPQHTQVAQADVSGFAAPAPAVSATSAPIEGGRAAASSNSVVSAQNHYLQIASYESLSAAQGLQNKLLEKISYGSTPSQAHNVVIHPSANKALYRVRIGPVASRSEVERLKAHPLLDSFDSMYPVVE
ncbi:MAG: septal ring lytic transglycosylase RlpA family protein [Pseudomonadales bacterium]|nr:septal ring lytic transglycosylase RlpA family protein [Pseudomonadales bacterium]MDG2079830.1 septal ring lytic transglycosylase RlpA family protein [Pseudomonadales bacterium]